jgi:vacuolar-type H+-ATPase subunit I/STV1
MQFLLNKTQGAITLQIEGGVTELEPFEALPVNVEKWSAKTFNIVKMMPHKLAICDRVPEKYVTKRQMYLDLVEASKDISGKLSTLTQDIKLLETEIAKEQEVRNEHFQLYTKTLEQQCEDSEKAEQEKLLQELDTLIKTIDDNIAEATKLLEEKQAELKALQTQV